MNQWRGSCTVGTLWSGITTPSHRRGASGGSSWYEIVPGGALNINGSESRLLDAWMPEPLTNMEGEPLEVMR